MESSLIGILIALLLGIPASYILSVMMLEEKNDHVGPFRHKKYVVKFVTSQHEQPVVLWDWIRKLAGVYTIIGDQWLVEEKRERVERFTCPFCLSFWTSFPFSLIALYLVRPFGILNILVFWFVAHFTIAVISQLAYRWLY